MIRINKNIIILNILLLVGAITLKAVAALPTVDSLTNISLCKGSMSPPIVFSGTANHYTWKNNNYLIGLDGIGTGNIASFRANNYQTHNISGDIEVTPHFLTSPKAYICNTNDQTVSVIDLNSNTNIATIPVGLSPNAVCIHPNGTYVYITNKSSNSVSVINTSTNTIENTISLSAMPTGINLSPDGKYLYISNSSSNSIDVIETSTNTFIYSIPMIIDAKAICVSRNGDELYVANKIGGTGSVSIINNTTNAIDTSFVLKGNINQIFANTKRDKIYALETGNDTIYAINTRTRTVEMKLNFNKQIGENSIAVSPNGFEIYVLTNEVNGNSYLEIINAFNYDVEKTILLGKIEDARPIGISISADGKYIYIANKYANTVSVLERNSETVIATIPVGNHPLTFGNFVFSGDYIGDPRSFTITVNPAVYPKVNISASSIAICKGETVNFQAEMINGGASPSYQWQINDTPVGFNSNNFSLSTINDMDVVKCTITSSFANCMASNITTDSIKITVKDHPTINSVTDQNSCDKAIHPSIPFSGHANAFEWTNDNSSIGLASAGTGNIHAFTPVLNNTTTSTSNINVTPISMAKMLFITNQSEKTITIINSESNHVVTKINSLKNPMGICQRPNSEEMYIGDSETNMIYIINHKSLKILDSIAVGRNPGCICFSPDGNYAYVTNENSNTLSIINTLTKIAETSIQVQSGPRGVVISPDGNYVYVSNTISNTVSVINTSSRNVIQSILVGNFPIRISISPDGKKVYTTNYISKSVSVINTQTNTLESSISVNQYPWCMTLNRDGSYLYVVNTGSRNVSVIETSTYTVHLTIPIDESIFGISINNDDSLLYLNSSLSFIKIDTNSNTIISKTPLFNSFSGDMTYQNILCCKGSPTNFKINIDPLLSPVISISTTNNSFCLNDTVRFNAISTNMGNSPIYQWTVNGLNVGTNSSTFSSSILKNNDLVSCSLISSKNCLTNGTATSNNIQMISKNSTSISNIDICSNALPFVWNGNSYTNSGSYTARLNNTFGCDSIATLNLKVKQASSITNVSICDGENYTFNGSTYSISGQYAAHLSTTENCDSIANLVLTIKQPSSSITNASICQGESYTFNGTTYNSNGTYTANHVNSFGCDSVATLNLTIKQPSEYIIYDTICSNSSYTFNNRTIKQTGTYTDHKLNSVGCDSTSTLNLTVLPSYNTNQYVSILYGETDTIDGVTYDNEGVYKKMLIADNGCDSIISTTVSFVRTHCPEIIVPKFITPNNDGINDLLEIENITCYPKSTIEVFDRFGKLIIKYKGEDSAWNGSFRGETLPSSDYWYIIILPETASRITGHFSLVR